MTAPMKLTKILLKCLLVVHHPRHARLRLALRSFNNILLGIAVFGVLVFAFGYFDWAWIADFVAAVALVVIFTCVWEKRAIAIRCPGCGENVSTDTPWVCGHCKRQNVRTDEYPFLNRCQHADCGIRPKTYKCHHGNCQELIFLTLDKDKVNYAFRCDSPKEVPESAKQRAARLQTHEETKEGKLQAIAIQELDVKLNGLKAQIDGPKIKTELEKKMAAADQLYDASMGIREYCRKKRAEAAEKFKDNPDLLRDANDAIAEIEKRFS